MCCSPDSKCHIYCPGEVLPESFWIKHSSANHCPIILWSYIPKPDSIIDSVCLAQKSSLNLNNLQVTYFSLARWFIEILILLCSYCRRIQEMKGKISSSHLPSESSGISRPWVLKITGVIIFVFQRRPWSNVPLHLHPKIFVRKPGKQGTSDLNPGEREKGEK